MAKTFTFDENELKLLLVAVRQMRRTFEPVRKEDPAVETYAQLYDRLLLKMIEMAGPLPDEVKL